MDVKLTMCTAKRNFGPDLKEEISIHNHCSWYTIQKTLTHYMYNFKLIKISCSWFHEIRCCRFIPKSKISCALANCNLDSWVLACSIGHGNTMTEKQMMIRQDNIKYPKRNILLVSQRIGVYRSLHRLHISFITRKFRKENTQKNLMIPFCSY